MRRAVTKWVVLVVLASLTCVIGIALSMRAEVSRIEATITTLERIVEEVEREELARMGGTATRKASRQRGHTYVQSFPLGRSGVSIWLIITT